MPFEKGHPVYAGCEKGWFPKGHQSIGARVGHLVKEETKLKLSEKFKGKHRAPKTEFKKGHIVTDETKRKIIENQLKNPTRYWLGKHFSEQHKEKLKKALWQNPIFIEDTKKRRLYQVFPQKDTSIECKLQDELSSREIGYYKHYPVKGQPDIAFPDKKIAVFADGDYWHEERKGRKESDAKVNEKLRNDGWTVLRYWEHEINDNIEVVVDEIEEIILMAQKPMGEVRE